MSSKMERCPWCGEDPLYQRYHDEEWGRPEYDDLALFEKLCLDGQQAGLSWITILKKQDNYRNAYDQFQPEIIAHYDQAKIDELMQDAGIVRNRLKVESVIRNAKGYLQLASEGQRFGEFLWQFVDGKTIQNQWQSLSEVPVMTEESQAMSKALKKKGFNFVGPTICYAFMQAVGMVNDHLVSCPQWQVCHDINGHYHSA